MKTAAIICEYNPFHNGHAYQIEMTRKKSKADFIIAIMSGQFTQRGIPAIFDKYERAKFCLLNDIDLVIELPTVFATASAEFFAKGAVKIANSLGIVDYLSFGSECENLDDLKRLADFLKAEDDDYKYALKQNLEQGYSFPKARSEAVHNILGSKYSTILNQPNNILAIEYLKALKEFNSTIEPISIMRSMSEHNSNEISSKICSSSAIRSNMLSEFDSDIIKNVIPSSSFEYLEKLLKNGYSPIYINDFSDFLRYKLITTNSKILQSYNDVSSEISQKIIKNVDAFTNYESFIELLKTKEITYSRISRSLLHILLNIDYQPDIERIYGTILGFKEDKSEILGLIKQNKTIPVISKNANYKAVLNGDASACKLFETDILANSIYEAVLSKKTGLKSRSLLTKSPIIIK